MENLWFVLPIIGSFLIAGLTIIVQTNKQIPPVMIFAGKSLFLGVALFPLMFFLNIPTDPAFFIAIALIAGANSISGSLVYSATQKFGGGITTRILPLITIITIASFFVIFPETSDKLFSNELAFLFIGCIFIMFTCIFAMSKEKTNLQALIFVAPSLFLYAFANVISKLLVDKTGQIDSILAFLCFANLLQGVLCLTFSKLRHKKKKVVKATFKFKKRYLIPLLGVSFCSLAAGLINLFTMKVMVNPGIGMLIVRAAPIWVYLYNVHNNEEKLDRTVIPSFLFLAFATATILLYNIIMVG